MGARSNAPRHHLGQDVSGTQASARCSRGCSNAREREMNPIRSTQSCIPTLFTESIFPAATAKRAFRREQTWRTIPSPSSPQFYS